MRRTLIGIIAAALAILLLTAVAWSLTVSSRSHVIDGTTVGEVLVDEDIPIRMRFSAGGYTPAERADTIAARLREIGEYEPADVQTGIVNGEAAVLIKGQLIATADSGHAAANNTTPINLAMAWRDNFRAAVAPTVPAEEVAADTGPVATDSKIVPVIGVGTGLRVGAAQVSGEAAQVARVRAVAQIEGDYRGRARVRALVPIGTEEIDGINRIPGTSVTAYGDVTL